MFYVVDGRDSFITLTLSGIFWPAFAAPLAENCQSVVSRGIRVTVGNKRSAVDFGRWYSLVCVCSTFS